MLSTNVERSVNVELETKTKLMNNTSLSDEFSLYKQYNRERDDCEKYRLILFVNPVCSNVLFNMKTEILINEGGDDCIIVGENGVEKSTYANNAINQTTPIKQKDAIKDTEYSHPQMGGFVYHCGVDIFNNHMLRNTGFVHVNKIKTMNEGNGSKVFNTIRDFMRDSEGDVVMEMLKHGYNSRTDADKQKLHIYNADNSLSFKRAFIERCKEKDGWFGFKNPGNVDIPNDNDNRYYINKLMNNNKPCEFIDLYPDRSLFSFIPKYNKSRNRIEKNWDYCITYPFGSDIAKINEICGGENGEIRATIKETFSSVAQLQCTSYFKHNLRRGDYISVYYYDVEMDSDNNVAEKSLQKIGKRIKVESVGDANGNYKDRIFSIRYADIEEYWGSFAEYGFYYKKISKGQSECSYYFRKFKKIKTIELDGSELVEKNLVSDINKVAFGENIYGDETAQIVYTDDVDISGLIDNLGRPVSEVYLTVVKRNAGYDKWYSQDDNPQKNYGDESIEFSHCFGKITSGLDFSGMEDEPVDYNIHRMHNITLRSNTDVESSKLTILSLGESIATKDSNNNVTVVSPKVIENNITIDGDDGVFYGDIVEFDIEKYQETVISNVYHRFNTAQREIFDNEYKDVYYDEMIADDYDINVGGPNSKAEFTVTEKKINQVSTSKSYYANIMPEGYFYNPHTKILVRELGAETEVRVAKNINYSSVSAEEVLGCRRITIDSPAKYNFKIGEYMAFHNTNTQDIIWGIISSVKDLTITIDFSLDCFLDERGNFDIELLEPENLKRQYDAFWSDEFIPLYAKLNGINKFVWRPIVPPSEMIRDAELYDTPFSNGRFYLYKNVNFFLRRQDPNGDYGLSKAKFTYSTNDFINKMQKFIVRGHKPIDMSAVTYIIDNLNTCY